MVESLTQHITGDKPPSSRGPKEVERGAKILAKTIYRELRESGLEGRDVVAIASEMLALVTSDIRSS